MLERVFESGDGELEGVELGLELLDSCLGSW